MKTQPKALLNSISKDIEILKEDEKGHGKTEEGNPKTEEGNPKTEQGMVIDEGMTEQGMVIDEGMTEQGIVIDEGMTEKGVPKTEKGVPKTEKGVPKIEKGVPKTEKGIVIGEGGKLEQCNAKMKIDEGMADQTEAITAILPYPPKLTEDGRFKQILKEAWSLAYIETPQMVSLKMFSQKVVPSKTSLQTQVLSKNSPLTCHLSANCSSNVVLQKHYCLSKLKF